MAVPVVGGEAAFGATGGGETLMRYACAPMVGVGAAIDLFMTEKGALLAADVFLAPNTEGVGLLPRSREKDV
jgi:hypothetical protein